MSAQEFAVVTCQIVGNVDYCSYEYGDVFPRKRWPTREAAITAGIRELGHDDFLIAVLKGDYLVGTAWKYEDREEPEEAAGMAAALGLKVRALRQQSGDLLPVELGRVVDDLCDARSATSTRPEATVNDAYRPLEDELAELERTDPAVAEAAASYERMRDAITGRTPPTPEGGV